MNENDEDGNFKQEIELFQGIDEINSSYVWDSEGDLQLTLKKLQRKVWPILK